MKFFNKQEGIGLIVIFTILLVISIPNFVLSVKRSRDVTRKEDLGRLVTSINVFQAKYKVFPESTTDGKIKICHDPTQPTDIDKNGDGVIDVNFAACEWGEESYLGRLPRDPDSLEGVTYFYVSNGKRYQIYEALEAKDDAEYNEKVLERKIMCGTRVCNAGRAYGDTPLDMTLEEYENKLINEKNK